MVESWIDKTLKCISDMTHKIKTSALKVEFITWYPAPVYSPETRRLQYEFLRDCCTDSIAESISQEDDLDGLVQSSFKDYMDMRKKNMQDGKLRLSQDAESEAECADKVFILLVKMFNISARYILELKDWSAERIALTVLEYMHEYYIEYWDSGKTPEEYFWKGLLTTVGLEP